MISREEIEHLAQLKSDSGIVSAYIGIRPRLMYKRKHPVTLAKGAFARAERKLHEGSWKEALAREGEKIVDFLNGWDVRGRGLVIFSSQPAGIWEVLTLEVPVPTVVDIDRTTKTGVLTRLLDEHPRLAVALIQRDEAKIYVSEQRISDQAAEVMSHVPGQHDQGGWAQARFERHIEFHMAEHLTKVVDELNQLDRARPFKWLVIGSTEKMAGEFLGMVPDAVARKVIGTFAVDFKHESEKEILERARKAYEEHERRTEFQLVHQVADLNRAAARKATMGITENSEGSGRKPGPDSGDHRGFGHRGFRVRRLRLF